MKHKNSDKKIKKIVIKWEGAKINDYGLQSYRLVGAAHPGCCAQSGGCGRKH